MKEPRDAQVTRDNLIRAGLALIASQGYHATKVSEIVRRCGVTQAAFYWHFPSKLELVLELMASGRATLLDTLRRGYRDRIESVDDMVENSCRWFTDLLRYCHDNREYMAILLARGYGADPQIDRAIADTRTAMYEVLRGNIARAVDLGRLQPQATDLRAAFVHRLLEGSIEWWLFGHDYDLQHQPTVSTEVLARQLAEFEFYGLNGSGNAG
ncbi:TetR/AcrR family transcriptional regulator [Pseudomonas sp. NPDC012596]|uniref:TetR/AcrR family transcriptional regulator n=1 Tax=Pseudomonas sp. NPDC012596 TaxID=3364419 RepID=UPI0036B0816B